MKSDNYFCPGITALTCKERLNTLIGGFAYGEGLCTTVGGLRSSRVARKQARNLSGLARTRPGPPAATRA